MNKSRESFSAIPYRIFRASNGETLLDANIYAQNLANAYANAFYNEATANILPDFLGKKIIRSDLTLAKALEKKFSDKQQCQNSLRHFHSASESCLCFTFKAMCGFQRLEDNETDYNTAVYRESYRDLGEILDRVLVDIYSDSVPLRTDYTAKEIIEARNSRDLAKEALSKAESALCGFGSYDR